MASASKMEKQYCGSCSKTTWHNPKNDGSMRCTYCGSPVTTNPSKRENAELIRKQQVAKVGRLV